ncbi:ATP-binding cassette domain-containing protein, partial [Clostridium thermosuccinogenes]|uniref:ATP-binding cassette domain-containing protein n=2 Tax=Clostridium thermosuccinogenes TaxID=84032 RepID=UPI001A9A66BE
GETMGIKVKNINKKYHYYVNTGLFKREKRYINAVKDVSFDVNNGEILGLVGSNGAGKTTIVKMTSGILLPDSGKIEVNGEDPFKKTKKFKKDVSLLLGQKGKLHPDMSIYEISLLYGSMYGLSKSEILRRIDEMSEILNQEKQLLEKQTRSLSLGQRMKGEISLAFINNPKVIFLDEPTLGLDDKSSRNIRVFLREYCKKNNASIILTSHNLQDIKDISTNLLIIKEGRVVYLGKIENLPNEFDNNVRLSFTIDSSKREKLERLYPTIKIDNDRCHYECNKNDLDQILNELYQISKITELTIEEKELGNMIEELLERE